MREETLRPRRRDRLLRAWRRTVRPVLLVVIALTTFRSAVADWHDVPTGSMKPTIVEGDRIFVNKLAYDLRVPFTGMQLMSWSNPERGDIVVFWSPEDNRKRLVKRVVAVPGDIVEMHDNRLFVNREEVAYEPLAGEVVGSVEAGGRGGHVYALERLDERAHPVMVTPGRSARRSFPPVRVPEGHYFVLGDNRDNSRDSRFFGLVTRDAITGEATAVAFSLDYVDHFLPRFDRFGLRLD